MKRDVLRRGMDVAIGEWELVRRVMCNAETEETLVPNWHLNFSKKMPEEIAVKSAR